MAKPRDKAKVEVAVQIVERWILAALRHRQFFSLAKLNAAIAELLVRLNERRFKKLPGSRRELFEQLDRPALAPLPARLYSFAAWKKVRVNIDDHIEIERHYYSVPYPLVQAEVEARISTHPVEILHPGRRAAQPGGYTTVAEHMPRPHREYAEWTPRRLVEWAERTGPATGPTGVGKTWIACALAHKACRDGHSARHLRLPRRVQELPIAKADVRSRKGAGQHKGLQGASFSGS